MVGVVLALVVVAILVSLLGDWIVGVGIGSAALILLVLFLARFGRRAAAREARRP